jgi:hypothetical protein
MSTAVLSSQIHEGQLGASIKDQVGSMIDNLIASLPNINHLTEEDRRGIIARYAAVLEGNFIYWMTATFMAVRSEEARPILIDNLYEEVRDCHPIMMRRFAIAAHAFPTDFDALSVDEDLTKVRRFLGRLSGVQSVLTMAFFEGFIQKFMGYLADLAVAQGSQELEYTDVHGVCDIAHTDGLFQALRLEMEVNPLDRDLDIFEGVDLLRNLIQTIIYLQPSQRSA